jgi:hypothetical protein
LTVLCFTRLVLDALPFAEKEARERQLAAGERGVEGGRGNKKSITLAEKIPQGFSRSRDEAAAMFGTNRQYVSDAKKIKELARRS